MPHILLVDDNDDLAEFVAERLRAEGYEVRTASQGEEGLRALDGAPLPDVVILDVEMPVMDGPKMAHEMLLHDAGEENIPILLMSSRHDLKEIAGRMGTPYFLQKTGDIQALLKMLLRVLHQRAAPSSA